MDEHRTRWVDRLLNRRPDLQLAELVPGRTAVVRRRQLLVAAGDVEDLRGRSGWGDRIDRVDGDDHTAIVRVTLTHDPGLCPAELAQELAADDARRPLAVTPNHILSGGPGSWGGGPADQPAPVNAALTLPVRANVGAHPLTVAVLDTGVSAHPWFDGTDWFAEVGEQDLEVLDELPQDDILDAQAGHGTFVIGVILQHAPGAYVVASRLLSSDGICDEYAAVKKLRRLKRWSEDTGRPVDVVNLSFGGYTVTDQPSPHLADAIAALGPETVVVACAGNDETDRPFWPAALDSVIAVGALDSDASDPAPFTNFGDWVDACAVGERVSSSFVTFDGPTPATGDFDDDRYQGFAQWSGTSFSTPHVAGTIAALVAERGISPTAAADLVLHPDDPRSFPGLGVVVPVG